MAALALAAAGFTVTQSDAIRGLMVELLMEAGNEAATNLARSREAMDKMVTEMSAKQTEMQNIVGTMHGEKESMKQVLEQMNSDASSVKDSMRAQAVGLQQMESRIEGLNLDAKVGQIQDMVQKLNDASAGAFAQLRDSYGGVEKMTEERFAKITSEYQDASRIVLEINTRLRDVEAEFRRGNVPFASGGGGGNRYEGNSRSESLVDVKDIKLPLLPDNNPSVAVFRQWWRDLAKYCQKREVQWRGADSLFRVIRGYPNLINHEEFPDFIPVITEHDVARLKTVLKEQAK